LESIPWFETAKQQLMMINPSIHQSINPSIHQSINPSIHQSTNPPIHQSTKLNVVPKISQ
jgi:hypothetical protein